MVKKIVIPYFPAGIRYSTPLPVGLGIYLSITGYPFWTVGLIALVVAVWTTNYVIEIDLNEKKCRDFLSIVSIPFEEVTIRFNAIEKMVITKEDILRC